MGHPYCDDIQIDEHLPTRDVGGGFLDVCTGAAVNGSLLDGGFATRGLLVRFLPELRNSPSCCQSSVVEFLVEQKSDIQANSFLDCCEGPRLRGVRLPIRVWPRLLRGMIWIALKGRYSELEP